MTERRVSADLPGRVFQHTWIDGRLAFRSVVRRMGWPALLVVGVWLVATIWIARLLVGRIDGLTAPPFDLGFFQQVVWSVGHLGQWTSSFHQGSFLGLHFSPILVVPALIERLIWPDVRVLSLIHSIAIGALVPAVFLFLRAVLRPSRAAGPLSAALAIGLPASGALQEVIRSDFHPEAGGVVLALLAAWAGLTGRPRGLWVLALLALATREDLTYAVGLVGLVVAARGRGQLRRHGRFVVLVAGLWAVAVFGVLMPWIRGGVPSDTASYYGWLGSGLGALTAPFTMTDRVVAALTRPQPWFVVAGMLGSLLGLSLIRPRWGVFVLPPLVALLLSSHIWQANILLQYPLILVVPVVVSAGLGGRRVVSIVTHLRRRWRQRAAALGPGRAMQPGSRSSVRWRSIVVGGLFLLASGPALAGAWMQGAVPPFDRGEVAFFERPGAVDRLERVAAIIPAGTTLVTDEGLVPALAGRPAIHWLVLNAAPDRDAAVLLDRTAWSSRSWGAHGREELFAALESSGRPRLADDGRFVLWGPAPGAGSP